LIHVRPSLSKTLLEKVINQPYVEGFVQLRMIIRVYQYPRHRSWKYRCYAWI